MKSYRKEKWVLERHKERRRRMVFHYIGSINFKRLVGGMERAWRQGESVKESQCHTNLTLDITWTFSAPQRQRSSAPLCIRSLINESQTFSLTWNNFQSLQIYSLWFFQSLSLILLSPWFFLGTVSMKKSSGAKHTIDYFLLNTWGWTMKEMLMTTAQLLLPFQLHLLFTLCPRSPNICVSDMWTHLSLNHP